MVILEILEIYCKQHILLVHSHNNKLVSLSIINKFPHQCFYLLSKIWKLTILNCLLLTFYFKCYSNVEEGSNLIIKYSTIKFLVSENSEHDINISEHNIKLLFHVSSLESFWLKCWINQNKRVVYYDVFFIVKKEL